MSNRTREVAYLVTDQMLSQDQVDRLREQWNKVHAISHVEAIPLVILSNCTSLQFRDMPVTGDDPNTSSD